ncbi:MAG: hypothetical protein V2A53_06395 [bacterium]
MRKIIKLGCLIFISLIIGDSTLATEEGVKTQDSGRVSIPWKDFRGLLQLDKDEVVLEWEDFQRLLSQTGETTTYTIKNGKVVLTREQFRRLLESMKPPEVSMPEPPLPYLITKATYKGVMKKEGTSFIATFDLKIFKKKGEEYITIPLFPDYIALEKVLFDNRPALIKLENSMHCLTTNKTGEHLLVVNFSLKTSLDQNSFSFPVPQTPITILKLEIPLKDAQVEISQAQMTNISRRGGLTCVSSLLSPTTSINVEWHKKVSESAKGPAKIYADTINLLSVEEDALRVNTQIQFSILQNAISSLILQVPDGYNILGVQGEGVGDWREYEKEKIKLLKIPLESARGGDFQLNITAERLLPEASVRADFSGFKVQGAIREKGFVGVELKSAAEANVAEKNGLDQVDVSELPPNLLNLSLKPILFGFKYLHHPYSLILDIQKHKELPVISTVIDSANGITLFTEDGKLLHQIVYSVRNTYKQFLEIELPRNSHLWSCFVAGEPVKPQGNDKGKILIPLNRSSQGVAGLVAFDVEIVYYQKADRFQWMGGYKKTEFPVPDVIMSQVLWSVYLPFGYTYLNFGGTVEKEKLATGIMPILGMKKVFSCIQKEKMKIEGKGWGKFSQNIAIPEEKMDKQILQEENFNQRIDEIQSKPETAYIAGTLPIRIQIPTAGQIYRFAKTIVSEEPVNLRFTYAGNGIMWMIKGVILFLILWVFYRIRSRISRITQALRVPTRSLQNSLKAKHIPFILFALMLLFWFISRTLSIILLFFLLLSLISLWQASRRQKKLSKETELKEVSIQV